MCRGIVYVFGQSCVVCLEIQHTEAGLLLHANCQLNEMTKIVRINLKQLERMIRWIEILERMTPSRYQTFQHAKYFPY
jgi:hypothetical protein